MAHLTAPADPGLHVTHAGTFAEGQIIAIERRRLLDAADVVVLLLSAEFASRAAHHDDATHALERHVAKLTRVVPVLCRSFAWEELAYARPLDLPSDGQPIAKHEEEPRDEALTEVARAVHALLAIDLDLDHAAAESPFPGLESFDEGRAAHYFGREAEIREALGRIGGAGHYRRWLVIDGPSGAGKSSFVRAGLIPAIRAGGIAKGPKAWCILVLRPGANPLASLALALREALPTLAEKLGSSEIEAVLEKDPRALRGWLSDHAPRGQGVLVVVDQLEEAFTLAEANRTSVLAFDASLDDALADDHGSLHLISTVRSEFMGRMGELPLLEKSFATEAGRYYLRAMGADALRRAIEEPAKLVGLQWPDGLPARIVKDAGTSPGALPLVAHAIWLLWSKRDGRTLPRGAYEAIGGVGGALARSADEIVDALGDEGKERARRLLLRLVKIGRERQHTLRSAPRAEVLAAAGGGRGAADVLRRLSGGRDPIRPACANEPVPRLVVVSGEHGHERVDLVHETLIEQWETLKAWIDQDRRALELQDDVEAANTVWRAHGASLDSLPTGKMLARFKDVELAALGEEARSYLAVAQEEECRVKQAAEEAERLAKKRELARIAEIHSATQRRQRRIIARLVALVLLLAILAIGAILLTRDLEAAKRAQITQANRNMAAMVAGTVLSQLRALGDVVERVAGDEKIARALVEGDNGTLQDYCESTYQLYDDPSRGLSLNGISPFNMWLVMGNDGIIKAQFGGLELRQNIGRQYRWRDYFEGARKLADKGLRSAYVSRAYESENDGVFKFTIAAPVYGKDQRRVGVIVVGVASDANLGSVVLDGTQGTAVLVAPRDRERDNPEPETSFLILSHPAIVHGEGVGMDDPQVREVSEAASKGESNIERPLWPLGLDRVTSSDHHQDPMASSHPDYAGKWLAAFAPVGSTGFVAIVQTRERDAGADGPFWRLAKWAVIGAIPGTLLFLTMSLRARKRRAERDWLARESLRGPTRVQSPSP